jgi:hypothetical protein
MVGCDRIARDGGTPIPHPSATSTHEWSSGRRGCGGDAHRRLGGQPAEVACRPRPQVGVFSDAQIRARPARSSASTRTGALLPPQVRRPWKPPRRPPMTLALHRYLQLFAQGMNNFVACRIVGINLQGLGPGGARAELPPTVPLGRGAIRQSPTRAAQLPQPDPCPRKSGAHLV